MLTVLLEVLVVDDLSRDRTREILRGLEERFPGRLRVVEEVEPPSGWLGKPHALHEGAAAAQKASVVDDILLGLRAKRAGFRCAFALALDAVSVRMYHGFVETLRGFAKNLYFGLGGTLVLAIPALLLTLVDGLLPTAVLFGGVAGFGPGPATSPFALALAAVLLTIGVRAAAHRRLGYPVASILFHPAFVLAIFVMAARSTWENGVLGRHTWRGRETDARALRF